MSRTGDLELVASSRDCIWAPWTVSQPLLGHSSTQLSLQFCVGSFGFCPVGLKGRMAGGGAGAGQRPLGDGGGGCRGGDVGGSL